MEHYRQRLFFDWFSHTLQRFLCVEGMGSPVSFFSGSWLVPDNPQVMSKVGENRVPVRGSVLFECLLTWFPVYFTRHQNEIGRRSVELADWLLQTQRVFLIDVTSLMLQEWSVGVGCGSYLLAGPCHYSLDEIWKPIKRSFLEKKIKIYFSQ